MSEWKRCLLGELITFGNGKARPKIDGNVPVYGGNGILAYANQANYDDETIVIGRVGAYCGATYYEKGEIWISDNALSAKAKNDNYPQFLYYFLLNLDLNQFAQGSSHPLLTQTLLKSIEVETTTNISEQQAIASVLSSLDDKIDLLQRQNQTLEQMAATLFRQWFIEEAKEDWETYCLKDLANIYIGRTPPRKESHWFSNSNKDYKWISIKDMADSGTFTIQTNEYLSKNTIDSFKIPVIPTNTVILSFKMTVGRVKITLEDMVSNEAIAQFQIKKLISKEFLYCFLKQYNFDTLGSTSSIVTAVNTALIKDIEVTIPNTELVEKFTDITYSMFNKIRDNQIQIQTLQSMRDTLLPKLISGEVRLKGFEAVS